MFRRCITIVGLLLSFVIGTAFAQNAEDSAQVTKPGINPSSAIEQPIGFYADRPLDSTHTQNPTVALFKSMFVPGWGQIGNKKYIKAAIVIGLEGSLIAAIIHNADRANDAKRLFDNNTDILLADNLYKKYKSARDDRNFYCWMAGLTIFISMFDAYVDAHLAHFPKYDKGLTFDLGPNKKTILAARLSYNF